MKLGEVGDPSTCRFNYAVGGMWTRTKKEAPQRAARDLDKLWASSDNHIAKVLPENACRGLSDMLPKGRRLLCPLDWVGPEKAAPPSRSHHRMLPITKRQDSWKQI